jgi:hypothetical protein
VVLLQEREELLGRDGIIPVVAGLRSGRRRFRIPLRARAPVDLTAGLGLADHHLRLDLAEIELAPDVQQLVHDATMWCGRALGCGRLLVDSGKIW